MADEEKPKTKTAAERLADEWREAGFDNVVVGEHTPGTHIITFFGAVPEEGTQESAEEER